jgi:uncharacterized protein (DUF433 family)
MPTPATSLRIPDETREVIEASARRLGRDFSSVANEMLAEAVKMRRIPGVLFADSPLGRVALVAGTGLAVWEVARTYREVEEDWTRLQVAYHWLSERQLRVALAYAVAYPDEIRERLAADQQLAADALWLRYPFLAPERR